MPTPPRWPTLLVTLLVANLAAAPSTLAQAPTPEDSPMASPTPEASPLASPMPDATPTPSGSKESACPPLPSGENLPAFVKAIAKASGELREANPEAERVLGYQMRLLRAPCAGRVQALRQAAVDPDTRELLVVGVGLAGEGREGARARLMAQRAAWVDAQRWLALHRLWDQDPSALLEPGPGAVRVRAYLVFRSYNPTQKIAIIAARRLARQTSGH